MTSSVSLRGKATGLCVGLAIVVATALVCTRALAEDASKPKPKSIFDDSGDTAAAKPTAPKPSTPPAKTSPTEPTTPPATEPPRASPPPPVKPASVPPKPAPKPAAPPAKAPVPAQADIDKALKLVKDVFADDYKKKAQRDRVALAERLLKQANEPGNDAASRYAMLREARDVAGGAGDINLALSAVDAIDDSFVVNAVDLKSELLTAAAKKPADAAAASAIAAGFVELSQAALAAADIERANKLIAQAEAVGKKAKNSDLTAELTTRKKELRDLTAKYGALGPIKEKLKKTPDDPAANLMLGKFYCFGVGDWDTGLPMLAKGSDAPLQQAARADTAGATTPAGRIAIGDGWWDLAEKQTGTAKSQLHARAGEWYGQAVADLTGLEKTRVEKRVAAISDEGTANGASASASAAKPDKGLRLLDAIVRKIPAESRPQAGRTWDGYRVGRWLTSQVYNTPFEAELTVWSANASRFNGRDNLYASFQPIGPVEAQGIVYQLQVQIDTRKDMPPDTLAKLTEGTHVRVRALVRSIDAYEWNENGAGKKITFNVSLADPTIAILPARSLAPGGTTGISGKRGGTAARKGDMKALLDTLVTKMPDAARPKPGTNWDIQQAQFWATANFKDVPVDDTVSVRSINLSNTNGGAQRIFVVFSEIGPAQEDGVQYTLNLRINSEVPADVERYRKLAAGESFHLRARIPTLRMGGYTQNNNIVSKASFWADVQDISLTPIDAGAAADPK